MYSHQQLPWNASKETESTNMIAEQEFVVLCFRENITFQPTLQSLPPRHSFGGSIPDPSVLACLASP